jgi:predicted transcriptional regulator
METHAGEEHKAMTYNDDPITHLGALEQRVMDALWEGGPTNIKDIIARLDNNPAYTTISTIVTNLERKGLVTSQRSGRTVIYSPVHSREVHAAALMEQALSTSNDRAASILHFVDNIEPAEVQLLRTYLQQHAPESQGDGS